MTPQTPGGFRRLDESLCPCGLPVLRFTVRFDRLLGRPLLLAVCSAGRRHPTPPSREPTRLIDDDYKHPGQAD